MLESKSFRDYQRPCQNRGSVDENSFCSHVACCVPPVFGFDITLHYAAAFQGGLVGKSEWFYRNFRKSSSPPFEARTYDVSPTVQLAVVIGPTRANWGFGSVGASDRPERLAT